MSSILQRFQQIADNEGISITRLEYNLGASKGVFSRALANKTDIQSKWLVKLVENYPQYSCDWLLKGIEPMILDENFSHETFLEAEINYKDLAEARKDTIDSLKKIVVFLEDKLQERS